MSSARVAVRTACSSDTATLAGAWFTAELASLQESYPDGYPPEWFWMTDVEQVEQRWMAGVLNDPIGRAWVAEVDGVPAGFAQTGPSEARPQLGVLRSLYVAPRAWGAGVGSALHAPALQALAAAFTHAEVWVIEGNRRARAFYERRGWSDAMESMRAPNGLPLVRYVRTFEGGTR